VRMGWHRRFAGSETTRPDDFGCDKSPSQVAQVDYGDSLGAGGLDVSGLSAWYGQARALFEVDIRVPRGSIVGLIGHNGAGKSTLLKAIARVHSATVGEIRLNGHDVASFRPNQLAALGVHLVREGAPIFVGLSVDDHVELGIRLARVRGKVPMSKDELWAAFPELVAHRRHPAGILSGGQRQLLCLAIAVVSKPSLLLLDEPSTGLSPTAARRVFSAVRELHLISGLSLVITEQRIDLLEQLTQAYYVMSVGRVIERANPKLIVGDLL
jgi:branched-chain amino acid transport system ATP-binding protein